MGRKRKVPEDPTNSNPTAPIEYKNGVHTGVHDQGHLDFSTPISYPNPFNQINSPKYGSVTKEVEAAINAQKKQVASFFAMFNQKLPNSPCAVTSPTSPSPFIQMTRLNSFSKSIKNAPAVDSDSDKGGGTEKNDKKREAETGGEKRERIIESEAVIVIDSDDEDAGENIKKIENLNKNADGIETGVMNGSSLVGTHKVDTDRNEASIVPFNETAASGLPLPLFPKESAGWQPQVQFLKVVLQQYPEEARLQDLEVANRVERTVEEAPPINPGIANYERKIRKVRSDIGIKRNTDSLLENQTQDASASLIKTHMVSASEIFSPVENPYPEEEMEDTSDDDLEDLWKDMSLAMEFSKAEKVPEKDKEQEEYKEREAEDDDDDDICEHSFMLRDDLGLVCKICGIIQKKIETIFDFQFKKGTRKSYYYERRHNNADINTDFESLKLPEDDFEVTEIAIHPRHQKLIKPHQMEGFNFLVKNLVAENPGGCILAHAPGSGKTFMLIAFIQSFLAKYPSARPLVILPKGILPTWKSEFKRWQVEDIPLIDFYSDVCISTINRWQVEDIPLIDFYSVKAEKRAEQLELLNQWQEKRSILFLGYKQFSTIICNASSAGGKVAAACQERLLKVPSLLILDEGHTPRNKDTNILESLAKVQTKRKVVLSGTLFQNHVQEVFNILNLVRPKFLQSDDARGIVKRVLSRVAISGSRRISNSIGEGAFYELVEQALQDDNAFSRKIRVIQDLRELTRNVLHYYKGDFLDELPGLVDLTIMLDMSYKQKEFIRKLSSYEKFKRSAISTAVYMHPRLSEISEIAHGDRVASCISTKIDAMMESINVVDGVKTKFFLNVLNLAVAAQEKLLVFSQYIVPLQFLERFLVNKKGWHVGKEIFLISGDTNADEREWSMNQFNNSPDAKVLFGSIKACGEGISLVGASRVIILDVHLNPSVTRQAIGRAFRPGQTRKVYVYRLVAADSPEERVHQTSFKKEQISKMWFEWSEHCKNREFELEEVQAESCDDIFFENTAVCEDVKYLYRRSISV